MVNNLNDRINCETGELNPPIGMAEAGHEEEAATGGAAFTREFGRGFKAGREAEQKIARAEPSRGAPQMTPDQFYRESDWHTSLGVAAKDMPPALIVTSRETAFAFAEAYANSRHVVLLEALRIAHRYFLQSNKLTVDDREMLDEMWAAIKQAERT